MRTDLRHPSVATWAHRFRASRISGIFVALLLACDREDRVRESVARYVAVDARGDDVSIRALRGQPLLLNVWATWCAPCREEISALDSVYRDHAPSGLHVVGVSIDDERSGTEVEHFAKAQGATYPIWLDPGNEISSALGTYAVPTTVLLDASGQVLWRHLGPVASDDSTLSRALASALRHTKRRAVE
jgi:peroxiredoxin